MTIAFATLSERIGETAETFLPKLREATQGLVTDFELMQKANAGVLLQLGLTGDEMAEVVGQAVKLGRAMGITATQAIESVIVGLGRQSKLWLDNLGIIVDTEAAYKKFAATLGVTTSQLTDTQKKTAFMEAAMAGMEVATIGLGSEWGLLSEKVTAVGNSFTNTVDGMLADADRLGGIILDILSGDSPQLTAEFVAQQNALVELEKLNRKRKKLEEDITSGQVEGTKAIAREVDSLKAEYVEFLAELSKTPALLKATVETIEDGFNFAGDPAIKVLGVTADLSDAAKELVKLGEKQIDQTEDLLAIDAKRVAKSKELTAELNARLDFERRVQFVLRPTVEPDLSPVSKQVAERIVLEFSPELQSAFDEYFEANPLDFAPLIGTTVPPEVKTLAGTFAKDFNEQMESVLMTGASQFASAFADVLVDSIGDADVSFQEFAARFLELIARMIIEALVLAAIMTALKASGFAGGLSGATGTTAALDTDAGSGLLRLEIFLESDISQVVTKINSIADQGITPVLATSLTSPRTRR